MSALFRMRSVLLVVAWGLLACSTSPGGTDGGTSGTSAGTTAADAGPSLYSKYGGAATVDKLVSDVVAAVSVDCVEAPYFAVLGQQGHDTQARLSSCLNLQLTALLGALGSTYPGLTSDGYQCEDLGTIHKDLGIPQPVFDRFVSDVAGVLAADGFSAPDAATITQALAGFGPVMVVAQPVIYAGCDGGAGYDAGSPGDSLYQKYGGAPGVGKIVGDALTAVTADCVEAPYFAGVGEPDSGMDSFDRLAGCLDVQFSALMDGPTAPGSTDGGNAVYPDLDVHGDACLSMTAAHQGLGVPGPVFDRFITDLEGAMQTDGVSQTDLSTLTPTLVGLKPQVVSTTPQAYDGCDGGLGYNPDGG